MPLSNPAGTAGATHDAVTLGTDADTLLGLSTQALSLDTQSANTVLAGPTTGAAADPTFRALVAADVPAHASTHTYYGYNTVGASQENMARKVIYYKKITLTAAGFLMSISAYIRHTNDYIVGYAAGVYTDNTNAPGQLIAACTPSYAYNVLLSASVTSEAKLPRWFHIPVAAYLAAGDYWVSFGVMATDGDTYAQIYYDASGSDQKHTEGGVWLSDGSRYTLSDSTYKYSIRASVLS